MASNQVEPHSDKPKDDHQKHEHDHDHTKTPTTLVITQQPISATSKWQPQNVRDWTSGMFGCCEDCGSCIFAFLCPPIYWCCLASKMDECCCGPACCPMTFPVAMRTKVRTMYGIKGTVFSDICYIYWCCCCAGTQMHRELKNTGYIH